jgi:hypothetical protein
VQHLKSHASTAAILATDELERKAIISGEIKALLLTAPERLPIVDSGADGVATFASLMCPGPDHIAQWWTKVAKIRDGKLIDGWSGFGWEVVLDVAHETSSRIVSWRCLHSNMQNTNAWEGTTMTFSLSPQADGTHLKFLHRDPCPRHSQSDLRLCDLARREGRQPC